MRSHIPSYELATLPSLAATLERMAGEPGAWRPFAGGTDLMVLLEAGKLPHRKFLNIAHLNELRGMEVTPGHVCMGALSTYSEIRRHEILRLEFPLLCSAAEQTGSIATQNRGT
ncbi:MAG: FAD binding domain-containing protein, partial [Candidatus Acidiferrales bacterium]